MSARACPACASASYDRAFEKQGVPYLRCGGCGLVFGQPARNANLSTPLADYEPSYLDFLDADDDDAANYARLLAPLGGVNALAGSRVLDVGAGGGKFVRFLRAQGVEAVGVEPAAALFERFLAGDPAFLQGTVSEVREQLPHPRFDAVFACDVIEHVVHPSQLVSELAELVRPGGSLTLTTPDAGSFVARALGSRWHHYNRYHLSLFDRRNLVALGVRHGFRPLHVAHVGRRRSLRYVVQYAFDFLGGPQGLRAPKVLERAALPLNLRDVVYAYFERS